MAKIFLDANVLINLTEKQGKILPDDLRDNKLFISTLSLHILIYVTKQKVPQNKLFQIADLYSIIKFDKSICGNALKSPTNDFEDNVQLHSAAHAECDFFLTEDKKLLDMKFFDKTRIVSSLTKEA